MAPTGSSSTEDLTSEVLLALSKADPILSAEAFPQVPFESLKAALDRLASRSMITYEQIERQEAFLEPEAEVIVSHGSHEARVFEAVHKAMGGLSIQELEAEVGDKNVTKVGQGKAFKEKWIKKEDNRLVALVRLSTFGRQILKLTGLPGGFNQRRYPRSTPDNSRDANPRQQDSSRSEEAQASDRPKGHFLQNQQGSQVCTGDGEGGDGSDRRHASVRLMEDGNIQ